MTSPAKTGPKALFRPLFLVLLVTSASCGGGTTLEGTVVRAPGLSYQIGLPGDDWSSIDVSDNHVAWKHDREPSSVIQVNGRCDEALDIPLIALRSHLIVGFTERNFLSENLIAIDGREALRTQVVAKLDGVGRHLDLVVLKKDGCIYDFSLITADELALGEATPSFETVLSQFRSDP